MKDFAVKVKEPSTILEQLSPPVVESENKLLLQWDMSHAGSVGFSLC